MRQQAPVSTPFGREVRQVKGATFGTDASQIIAENSLSHQRAARSGGDNADIGLVALNAAATIQNTSKVQMEMGSKNSLIVMDDADLDLAVTHAAG